MAYVLYYYFSHFFFVMVELQNFNFFYKNSQEIHKKIMYKKFSQEKLQKQYY